MKKLFALILAVMLVVSMTTVVSAASTTTLTTTVPAATYTLNIPANQEIPFGAVQADIGNITVTEAAGFAVGKNLEVTVTYDAFSASELSTTVPYSLALYAASTESTTSSAKQSIPTGSTFLFLGESTGSVNENTKLKTTRTNPYDGYSSEVMIPVTTIQFSASNENWAKALAGEYTSTITFTAEVVVTE